MSLRLISAAAAAQTRRSIPPGPPPIQYARFADGNAGTVITGDGRILTMTGGGGIASCLTDAAVTGNVYVELLCTTVGGEYAGACGYGGTVRPLPDGQELGNWWTEPGFDFTFSRWTMWWSSSAGLPEAASGSDSNSGTLPGVYRAKLAIRASSRKFWLQRDSDGWIGDGDPVADTDPTFTLGGSSPIYLGASLDPNSSGNQVELLTPDAYEDAAPAGFTPGIIIP